jgi:DNA-binding beta-propeller fold protein YncE
MRATLARTTLLGGAVLALSVFCAAAGHPLSAQDTVKPETVVVNLANPCGIAVQPDTNLVFVSSRWGVYRYDPSLAKPEAHKATIEIDGYPEPIDVYGKGPKYEVGPMGLAFLDKNHLIVGDGSRKDGEELVRIYKIPDKAPTDWAKEDSAVYTLGPIKAGKESEKGEGNFYGVAVGAGAIWVSCNGDDTKGWVAKAEIKDGKPGELKPTIATKVATQVDGPVPVIFTPDGKELVIGQMGEINVEPGDSLLTFYDPANGSLKRKLKAGLLDISGVAYSPKTGKLYATDFAWAKPAEGGLFELVIEGDNVKATKLAKLDKPTALAFDKDGRLYVTIIGTAKSQDKKTDPGALLMIKPGL